MNGIAFLKIMKGVQKVPGDTFSAEQGLDEIDLLDPNGFSCDEYDMKIPALKSSAVYADSPLSDGRTLISGALGNVTETIRLQLTAGTIIQMAAMLSKLLRFKQDCNDFWDTFGQIEPVYIKHQVIGEPGPRYALLYDIDIDPGQQPLIPSEAKRTVTLSIEREFGWRGLAPGDNPKKWTAGVNSVGFTTTNASFASAVNNLVSDTVENITEWSSIDVQTNKNYVDIPASLIPGDLPALVNIATDVTASGNLLIGLNTKPTSLVTRSGGTEYQYNVLAAASLAAGNLLNDTTFANDTGAPLYTPGSVNRRRANISFATVATDALRLRWRNLGISNPFIDVNTFRGRYAVYARARQVGGAAGDIKMSLEYGVTTFVASGVSRTTEVQPTLQAGTGNTTVWPITYMGIITLLPSERASNSGDGLGLYSDPASGAFMIGLYARRTTGVGVLYVSDLILVPIDEAAALMKAPADNTATFIYDTTGYFLRGDASSPFASQGGVGSNSFVELSGQCIYLQPQRNNRLYFINYATTLESSVIASSMSVRVNIIPRWSGLRDV